MSFFFGEIIIVGLAKPSNALDYLVEGLRVIPVAIISKLKKMKSSEDNGLQVSYELPSLNQVRNLLNNVLGKGTLKYGLYYRYLYLWYNNDARKSL